MEKLKSIEVERRFPVLPDVFPQVEANSSLRKMKEYNKIVDTYYMFNLLKRVMVRARHSEQVFPKPERKFELCAKELFSPSEMEVAFSMSEVSVNVDSFEGLQNILEKVKEQEFNIEGSRRSYRFQEPTGPFPTLTITTDHIDNLHHKEWIEIEIMLGLQEAGNQPTYSLALNTIADAAQKGFGVRREYITNPDIFPTYPEIHFWENWYSKDWCADHGEICKGMNPNWPSMM